MITETHPVIHFSSKITKVILSRSIPENLLPDEWPSREQSIATHPAVVQLCSKVVENIKNGPGFSILTLDRELASHHSITVAYWNLFTCLAEPLPHSSRGDLVYKVESSTQPPPARSYYSKSNIGGDIHTDGTYIHIVPPFYVGLICLGQARYGGESIIVDGRKIYDELISKFPNALHWLKLKYHFDCDDQMAGMETIKRHIISKKDSSLHIQYLRNYINLGHRKAGVQLEPGAVESMDILDELLDREDFRYPYKLGSGEMLILNNHMMLHGRNAFTDDEEGKSKRVLIRLWGKEA